jgi:hypothetical protein
MTNQKCPWRFGEPCEVTDFVTPHNVGVREAAVLLTGTDPDTTVENAAIWIRDEFIYPLDAKGNPSADGQLKRYQHSWCKWMFSKYVYYMWAYPNEVLLTRKGICIATANLCTSVMVALGLDAWTVLGEVRKAKDDALIGYHAWTDVLYRGERTSVETTVEEKVNILFPAKFTGDRCSEWAQTRNLYYVPQSKFNQNEYILDSRGDKGFIMMELIGLPASQVEKRGFYNTKVMAGLETRVLSPLGRLNARRIEKDWRKEEKVAKALIRRAYHA